VLGPDLDDPDLGGLGVDAPAVDDPSPDGSADQGLEADLSPELRREFLLQAGGLNLGLLATALGALVLGFREATALGGGLVLAGAVVLSLTAWRYVRHAPSG
jgi:hypothetical protein